MAAQMSSVAATASGQAVRLESCACIEFLFLLIQACWGEKRHTLPCIPTFPYFLLRNRKGEWVVVEVEAEVEVVAAGMGEGEGQRKRA